MSKSDKPSEVSADVNPSNQAAARATGTVAAQAEGSAAPKKKRKYSRGLKQFQKSERSLAKVNRRISRAVASGFGTYYERSDASSRKKRDGAIKDAVKNWGKGMSKAIRKASDAPNDVASAFDTKAVRRQIRQVARLLTPF